MAGSEYTIGVRLTADGKGLYGELRTATGEIRRFGTDGVQAASSVTRGMSSTQSSVAGVGEQLRRARAELIGFFTIRGAIELARGVGTIADNYANVQGKLRTVTTDTAQLGAVSGRVFAIAQQTSTALDATAQLAVRNTRVFASMGQSNEAAQQRGLQLAETIQKALAVSGATATESTSLVQQLGQGLQSGVLAGDEFKSVMENGGRVVQALAEHTGKTVAELRKLAEQGKLTSQVVLDSLSAAADKIDTEFARNVPLTLGRAWQQLANAVTVYVGEADQASGTTRTIAQAIVALGQNLDTVATALGVVAAVGALAIGRTFLGMVGSAIAALRAKAAAALQSRAALSAELDMQAAVSGSIARMAVARSADLQATLQTIAAARQDATAQLAGANARAVAAQRAIDAARAAGAQSAALRVVRDSEVALTAAQRARAAAMAELAALGRAQAAVEAQLAAAANAQVAAQTRAAAADNAAAAATSRLTAAKALLASASSGLLALIGGWPTVVLAAGVAMAYYATRTSDVSAEVDRLLSKSEQLRANGFSLADAYRALATGQELRKQSLLDSMAAQLAANEAEMRALELADQSGRASEQQRTRYLLLGEATETLRGNVSRLREAQTSLNYELLKASAIEAVVSAYRTLTGAAAESANFRQRLAADSAALGRSLTDDVDKYNKAARELGKTQEQIQQINLQRAIAERAAAFGVREGTEAYKLLVAEMTKAYGPVIAAAAAHDKATAAQKAQTAAARALTSAENDAESASSRLAEAQGQLADFTARAAGELSPAARVAADYERRLRDIATAGGKAIQAARDHATATKNLTGLAAAEARIQAQVAEAIAATTAQRVADAAAIAKQGDVLGTYLEQLRRDYEQAGLSERERAIAEAVAEVTEQWERNRDAHIANAQSLPELQGRIAATAGALYDQAQALERARAEAENYGRIVRSAMESAVDATAEWAVSGFRHARDYWRSMVDLVKRSVAQMLAEWAKARIIGMFTGNGGGGGSWWGATANAVMGNSAGGAVNLAANVANGGIDLSSGSGAGGSSGMTMFNASGLQPGAVVQNVAGRWIVSNPSTVGQIGAIGGAVAGAAYGLTQRGGSNFSGGSLAAGATYGIAGYAAGTVIASSVIGGAAAGAAGASAAAMGAMAAIPVIGWIALAIALIDKFTGGQIFGSRFKPERYTQTVGLDAQGGFAEATVVESRQRSLFRGRQWQERGLPAGEQAAAAGLQLEQIVNEARERTAATFGNAVAAIVEGSFKQVYDKKGKLIEEGSTVLGVLYKETFEAFSQRMIAENVIAQIDAMLSQAMKSATSEASEVAQRWRATAETLLAGAQFLIQAAADIQRGTSLLGVGATLTAVTDIVEELGQSNETLIATYGRLVAETTSVRDAFALAGQSLRVLGADLVRFADNIATEAGGGDAAAQLWNRLFGAFYTQAELAARRLDQLRPMLTSQLGAVGLGADTTMQQFRDEFERRLPTLTAAQIVQWLRLGDTLATVNELIGQTVDTAAQLLASQGNYAQFVIDIEQQLADISGTGFSDFQKALSQIGGRMLQNIRTANELARAAGLQGARESDLARIHALAAAQAAQAARQLELATQDLVAQLYGRRDLAEQGRSVGFALQDVATGLDAVRDAAQRFRDGMLLDNQLSPLSTQQQLQEALAQLRRTGDENVARRALELGRALRSTGDDFTQLFNQVMALVRPQPSESTGGRRGGGSAGGSTLDELSPAQRMSIAQTIAQNIADLSGFDGRTFDEIAAHFGFTLRELGNDLGLQGSALQTYLQSLQADSYALDDLAQVIAQQVDRIIAAIRGDPQHESPPTSTPLASGGAKPTAPSVQGPRVEQQVPQVGTPAAAAAATNAAIGEKLDKLIALMETGLKAIAEVAATTGGDTVEAVDAVRSGVREAVHELRALNASGTARGVRVRDSIA